MKFFFCGGSNTDHKRELHPNLKLRIKISEMYPDIVSKHFDASYVNVSITCASNKRTIRKIFYEYNMEEYDLICIDFTPKIRTEFYNDEEKRWEKIIITTELPRNRKLCEMYYENFYNDEYGVLMSYIEFNSIRKYLRAIKKPHLIFNSSKICNDNNLDFDLQFLNYHIKDFHLTSIGHKQVAKEIIRYYENYLQRG